MIKSMTGYGCAKGLVCDFSVTIELKSVNNRYLETSVKLPRSFMFAEETIKEIIANNISRGKVDVFINVDSINGDNTFVTVNDALLKGYYDAIQSISNQFEIDSGINAYNLARFPDVLCLGKNDIDVDKITTGLCSILLVALDDYNSMREIEGEKLKNDILNKINTIETFVYRVESESPITVAKYKEKLELKIRETLADKVVDDSRIIQEVAIFADRIAVDEEIVRLKSHIFQLKEMLEKGSPIGRKIDFLIQEFNRESNTIGSKCQSSEIAHVVVDLKSEIEKIREQVQNIE